MLSGWHIAGSTPLLKIRLVSTAGSLLMGSVCSIRSPDPDDLIFPRAATRVGPKYQVGALPVPGQDDPAGEYCSLHIWHACSRCWANLYPPSIFFS